MKKANRVNAWVVLAGVMLGVSGAGCGNGGGAKPSTDSGRDASDGGDARPDMTDGEAGTPVETDVRILATPNAVMVAEGSTPATFTVSLDRPWSSPITLALVSGNPNVATVVPETLTFAPGMTGPVMVMVWPTVDDDTADNTTSISVFSPETGSVNIAVSVDDMDVQGLLVTPPRVSMTEGRTEALGVRLAKRPASPVVVTLASSNATKLAVSPATLTFTPSNYSNPQSAMLTAAQDDDANLDSATVTLTATGNIAMLAVPVEITDDDAVNLDVTPATLNLVERSNIPGTIEVRLTRAPSADVTVTVASSSGKATVSPATLTFTAANFGTTQMVQVSAVADNDARDEMVTVTLAASGVIPAPPARTVAVAIDDPDSQMLQVMPSAITVVEGSSVTFDVRLLLDPSAVVTVNVFSQNPGKLEVLPPILNFNSTTFGTPQTVTVRSLDDDDLTNDMINVTLATSTAASSNVAVMVTDDDHQAIQLIPQTPGNPLVMQETAAGGVASTSPLGVRLAFRPAAATTVTIASSDAKLTRSPGTLTFTPANYANVQFVTLGAPHDGDMVNDMAEIVASATGIPNATLGVQILDIDIQNFNVSATSLGPITEGSTASFNVKLTVQPTSMVIAGIFSNKDSKVSVDPALCVFTAANYNTGCAVTVTAVNETPDDTRDETATVSISDMAGAITSRMVAVSVDDTDEQVLLINDVEVATTALPLILEGATAMFNVRLRFNPVDPVAVAVFSGNPAKAQIDPPVINFTPGSGGTWMMNQPVTVTALHDDDVVNESMIPVTVAGTAAGAANAMVSVSIDDDDTQVIQLVPTAQTIQELAGSQFGVRLAFRPDGPVSVLLTSQDSARLSLSTTAPPVVATQSLNFDSGNFSTTQFVNLRATKDNDMANDTVAVTAAAVAGAGWANEVPANAIHTVSITDVDALNFDIGATTAFTLLEDPAGSPHATPITVRLTVRPSQSVPVTITSNSTSVTLSSTSCTIGTGLTDWSTGCPITITADQDLNALSEIATVTVSAPGIAPRTVIVTTVDNETQMLDISSVDAAVVEGGGASGSFVVRLTAQPAAAVTVSFIPSMTGEVTLASTPNPCVLTSTSYTTGCTVAITGLEDLDLVSEVLTIDVSAPGLGLTTSVPIEKSDNDTQQLVLRAPSMGPSPCGGDPLRDPNSPPPVDTGTTLTVDEDLPAAAGKVFCVSLAFQPTGSTTVTLTPTPMAKIGVSPSTLTFTTAPSDYYTSRPVTVRGLEDVDAANDTGSVLVSHPVVDPPVADKSVTVTITDNDRELRVTPTLGGSVTSGPGGINACTNAGIDTAPCVENYMVNTVVTLLATPTEGGEWEFVIWGGDCSASGTMTTAMVSMSAAKTCSATFKPRLTVRVTNGTAGGGVVNSDAMNPGITDCETDPSGSPAGGDCAEFYNLHTVVPLTATPDMGWALAAWSGACTGTSPTTSVTMEAQRTCTARFNPLLTITVTGTGTISTMGGTPGPGSQISGCTGSCSTGFAAGDMVMLTNSHSVDWDNPVLSGSVGCSTGAVTMGTSTAGATRSCTARFDPRLTITLAGGDGSVTGAGISCSRTAGVTTGTCQVFPTLASTPSLSATTGGVWAGDCLADIDTPTTATVMMSAPRSCTVTF